MLMNFIELFPSSITSLRIRTSKDWWRGKTLILRTATILQGKMPKSLINYFEFLLLLFITILLSKQTWKIKVNNFTENYNVDRLQIKLSFLDFTEKFWHSWWKYLTNLWVSKIWVQILKITIRPKTNSLTTIRLPVFPGNLSSKSIKAFKNFRYSVGNSKFTSRPPTGVDLALGLNGYDKLPVQFGPARAPSSLQPLDDLDDLDKCRRRMARRETEDIR